MANTHNLFQEFNGDLQITVTKKKRLIKSRDILREKIRKYFKKNYPDYKPMFCMQGSYKMSTTIRTKDDTCDIDDGVYFKDNTENLSGKTLQARVKKAVEGTTDDISHRKKCITVNYKADYNIDLPVYVFDKDINDHPSIAIKDEAFREDDPKEMVEAFNKEKDKAGQLLRLVRYLKAWCDYKRNKMPSGLSMTILAMNNWQSNDRDDIAVKYTLIEIEKVLKVNFSCRVPVTPHDDIFAEYDEVRKRNFMDNLASFIDDAKKAVDEKNQHKASLLWKKHLGDRFPIGKDIDDESIRKETLSPIVGNSKPYYHEF